MNAKGRNAAHFLATDRIVDPNSLNVALKEEFSFTGPATSSGFGAPSVFASTGSFASSHPFSASSSTTSSFGTTAPFSFGPRLAQPAFIPHTWPSPPVFGTLASLPPPSFGTSGWSNLGFGASSIFGNSGSSAPSIVNSSIGTQASDDETLDEIELTADEGKRTHLFTSFQ